MKFLIIAAPILLLTSSASAQTVDWCASPLSFQADPGTALVWRLRCTIQVLDHERVDANDHVTTAEIDKAVSEAHLKELQMKLEEANKKIQDMEEAAKKAAGSPEKKK